MQDNIFIGFSFGGSNARIKITSFMDDINEFCVWDVSEIS
jgi:hypothetical protein